MSGLAPYKRQLRCWEAISAIAKIKGTHFVPLLFFPNPLRADAGVHEACRFYFKWLRETLTREWCSGWTNLWSVNCEKHSTRFWRRLSGMIQFHKSWLSWFSFGLSFEATNSGDCCTLLKALLLDGGWMGTTALTVIIIPSHNTKTISWCEEVLLLGTQMLMEHLLGSSPLYLKDTSHNTFTRQQSWHTILKRKGEPPLRCWWWDARLK